MSEDSWPDLLKFQNRYRKQIPSMTFVSLPFLLLFLLQRWFFKLYENISKFPPKSMWFWRETHLICCNLYSQVVSLSNLISAKRWINYTFAALITFLVHLGVEKNSPYPWPFSSAPLLPPHLSGQAEFSCQHTILPQILSPLHSSSLFPLSPPTPC